MSTTKEYLNFVSEQLSDLGEISHRAMMGEYVLYYREKLIGGIYDDRLLLKPTEAAKKLMPNALYISPYKGAKEMLLVDNMDDKTFLAELIINMYEELPPPKPKKKK